MDDNQQGPRRHLVAPTSASALLLLQNQGPLDDWYFANHELESSLSADGIDEEHLDNEEEFQEFEEFDEGDDLEPDLAASLSTADREAEHGENCFAFIPNCCSFSSQLGS